MAGLKQDFNPDGPDQQQQFELTTMRGDSSDLQAGTVLAEELRSASSGTAHHDSDPQEGATIQELAPVDRGIKAWTFCFAGFILDITVWGFSFSYGIFQDYYSSHPPFNKASGVAIAAVGTVALAIQYGEIVFLSFIFGRYPELMRPGMWAGVVLYSASLFLSS